MKKIMIRQDYHVCPNPLSGDSYNMCEHGCRYCFIQEMQQGIMKNVTKEGIKPVDLVPVENVIKKAFHTEKESSNPSINALRAGLPVIIGRKSEPFCSSEKKYKATERYLKLLDDHGVVGIPETKGFIDINSLLKTNTKAILISILPTTPKILEKLEPGLPSMEERFKLAEQLKSQGLFVGITGEPLLSLGPEDYKRPYLDRLIEIKPDHVNFGEYRCHNPRYSYNRMKEVGIDLRQSITTMKTDWVEHGAHFMGILQENGVKCSTPDWLNFGFNNSCLGCCGLDGFKVHKFNFQYAMQYLKEHRSVSFSDISKHNIFGEKYELLMKERWNNKNKKYFSLDDSPYITRLGVDSEGNNVYTRIDKKPNQRSLL